MVKKGLRAKGLWEEGGGFFMALGFGFSVRIPGLRSPNLRDILFVILAAWKPESDLDTGVRWRDLQKAEGPGSCFCSATPLDLPQGLGRIPDDLSQSRVGQCNCTTTSSRPFSIKAQIWT